MIKKRKGSTPTAWRPPSSSARDGREDDREGRSSMPSALCHPWWMRHEGNMPSQTCRDAKLRCRQHSTRLRLEAVARDSIQQKGGIVTEIMNDESDSQVDALLLSTLGD